MSNQKVRLKESGKIGIVKDVFINLFDKKVLVVELENGELVKCLEADIDFIVDEPEHKDKVEVTITDDYFCKLIAKKVNSASKGDYHLATLLSLFGALLATEIFGEKADHD